MTQRRPSRRRILRLYCLEPTLVRAWFYGPKWKRLCGVREVPISDVVPADQVGWHRKGKRLLVFSHEDEIRERVLDEIRPGVFAMWTDPRL
jgi:hypothetical protein